MDQIKEFEWLDLPLNELPFICLDLETTGYAPPYARITEIAMIKNSPDEKVFQTLVNPVSGIGSNVYQKVVSAKAIEFDNRWNTNCDCISTSASSNPYTNGTAGNKSQTNALCLRATISAPSPNTANKARIFMRPCNINIITKKKKSKSEYAMRDLPVVCTKK